ncbi:phosphotransferase enzyme family protein [Hoeflea olei]|uniref:Aminoglycoside phosphotransferase domain-containing protein n=1 Tax=Hoeflea olei TaxID=1480615 RepID=A0A1C1YTX9_9HYPH|nr:aminoglycoside phosphotransferase family protein [Hoeflea olei]OCW56991.1 hypothetical protein AWJ14_07500 [Hoeflea olei]
MTSDTGFQAPIHPGHDPIPLRFTAIEGEWVSQALPDLAIAGAERAEDGRPDARTGYYRLTLADGRQLFAKVKAGERAERERQAAALSSQLHRLGAATLAAERIQSFRQDGLSLFLYPWVAPAFYDGSLAGLTSLGEALALLHGRMRALPPDFAPRRHLLDLWQDRLGRVAQASFADDYRRALGGAGEAFARGESQIAHNDIHRGNVLFSGSKVVAFIDFEDAVATGSSPLVDIAGSLERFCLSPEPGEEKVRALLAGYARRDEAGGVTSASGLVDVGLCRCYHALAILEFSKAPENPAWVAERTKFTTLLDRWSEWGKVIDAALRGLGV